MIAVLYTTHCPKCRVVELKLKQKGINYVEVDDLEKMKELGLMSAPYLKVEEKLMGFADAIQYINSL